MKIKKAFWACSAIVPATIAPLSITSCGCSQAWGYKTPISIGTNIKGSKSDPYHNFTGNTTLVDLDGKAIVNQLQSNYAIDLAHSTYYGYSLPQKWNANKENTTSESTYTKWNKGGFEEGSAGWLDYSSSDFVKSNTISGTWEKEGTTKNISKTVYSYRNNTLASNIELVSLIGTTINQYLNYALSYQGTQLGTEYVQDETNTNLGIAWGGTGLVHGASREDTVNRQFMESIFASNGVSGTGKYNAVLRPSQVEFEFKDGFFPIVSYAYTDGKLTGVNDATLTLLNGEAKRPSDATKKYYSSVTENVEEKLFNFETGNMDTYKYNIYTYTNVPVIVSFNSIVKSFVNPTINNSFMVSDYYSDAKTITSTIGNSWKESLPKFAGPNATEPSFRKYGFSSVGDLAITPAGLADKVDGRIVGKINQNDFVILLNYSYKQCIEAAGSKDADKVKPCDRATMTGLSTILPACLCDTNLKVLGENESFFRLAKDGQDGYIFDTNVANKYSNLLLEIYKRTTGQGLVVHAKDLNDTSKKLVKFLAYMFGDNTLKVDTSNILTTVAINE